MPCTCGHHRNRHDYNKDHKEYGKCRGERIIIDEISGQSIPCKLDCLPKLNQIKCDVCEKIVCIVDSGKDNEPLSGYRVFCSDDCLYKFDKQYRSQMNH